MGRKGYKEYMMIALDRGIEFYLSTLETEGKSPAYISGLKKRLGYFLTFIEETHGQVITVQDLTVQDGRGFLRSLMEREEKYPDHPMHEPQKKRLKPHYIHGCGRAVRSFSTWAYEEGYLDENIMRRLKLPKLPQTQPVPLKEEEIKDVLEASLRFSRERLRNYAILLLFLDTGIRLGELVGLNISDIDFTASQMKVFGKGSKERTVPIGRQAKRALIEYLSRERPEPQNPKEEDRVFLTANGYGISKTAINAVFRRVRLEMGLAKFHPHMCRHTFAVRYLINGGDAFSLQKILGHTSLEMTRKHVNLAVGDLREKHRQFSPMDNLSFRGNGLGRLRKLRR